MKRNQGFVLLCTLTAVCIVVTTWCLHWVTDFSLSAIRFTIFIVACVLFFVAINRTINRASLSIRERVFPIGYWLVLAAVCVAYDIWQNRIDRLPNSFAITGNDDSHFLRFDFKQNGLYKFSNGFLGPDSLSYGSYVRQDSLIFLQPESTRNLPASLQLLIRPYSISKTPSFNTTSSVYNIYKVDTAFHPADYHVIEFHRQ